MLRNDGNTIEMVDVYELFYWNDSKWNTVYNRVATQLLHYDSVPNNGLYVLKVKEGATSLVPQTQDLIDQLNAEEVNDNQG